MVYFSRDIVSGNFIWNKGKEDYNILKHGVDFVSASRAFQDTSRKIFKDDTHSGSEERYFCIGRLGERILTVRFTFRDDKIRIIGVGYWRKGSRYYYETEK
jgi:uncharacterized protein